MKKRILNISLILSLASTGSVFAQQGFGTNNPDKSAAVEIRSVNKGLLIPRMNLTWNNGQIEAPISGTPAQGLLVYNKTAITNVPEGFYYYSANAWHPIGISTLEDSTTTTITGNGTANQPYKVEVKNLVGDVTGTTVANKVEKIQNVPVSSTVPSNGQVLKADSGTWKPTTLVTSDISDPKNLTTSKPLNASNGTGAVLKDVNLTIDTATTTTLGVVQIGSGINVDANGVISVPAAPGETTTVITDALTGLKHKIADYKNETATAVDIFETVTSIVYDSSTNVTHISEDTSTVVFNLGDEVRKNQNASTVSGTSPITIDSSTVNRITNYTVGVNKADTTTFGVVQIGNGINVNNGVISVEHAPDKVTVFSQDNTTGVISYKNEADSTTTANVVNNESANIINYNNGAYLTQVDVQNNQLKYEVVNGNYTNVTVDSSTANLIKYKVDVTLDGSETKLDSGTNTTLVGNGTAATPYKVGVNTANGTNLGVVKQGTNTTVVDGEINVATADINTLGVVKPGTGLTINNGTLNVSLDGSETKLDSGTNTTLVGTGTASNPYKVSVATADTNTLGVVKPGTGLTINNGTLNVDLTSTDVQQLSLTGDTLTLERGGSVDLSKYLDNTDNQSLSFDSSTHTLSITGDTKTINLSNYKNKEYTLSSDTNTISLLADGTSVDSETVVKSVGLSLSPDNKLTATVNGVANTTALDLSIINTDNQYLTYDTTTYNLSISGDTRTVNLSGLVTKLDTGTNTTLVGNGTAATPYKVGVNTANGTNLGVVKQGTNTTVVDGAINVATADTNTLGVVKPGTGLTINNGTLNVTFPSAPDGSETKLDSGTNTTLIGNGTAATPYKVGVNTANGKNLGVVKEEATNPTVNVSNGELAVNLTNTVLSGEVTGPLNNTIVANDVIDAENLKANAVTTAKILDGNVTTAKIQPATDTSTTKILTTNSNGVVEWKNSAMPEFFYFPAINIPLGSGVQTLNLYNIYSSRWSQPAVVSNNAESQTLQSILIPENMLDIYITYYDTNVINSTTIKIINGVLEYEVNSNYTITDESYMNIVFRIRKTPKN